jgi:hypothetical protein
MVTLTLSSSPGTTERSRTAEPEVNDWRRNLRRSTCVTTLTSLGRRIGAQKGKYIDENGNAFHEIAWHQLWLPKYVFLFVFLEPKDFIYSQQ